MNGNLWNCQSCCRTYRSTHGLGQWSHRINSLLPSLSHSIKTSVVHQMVIKGWGTSKLSITSAAFVSSWSWSVIHLPMLLKAGSGFKPFLAVSMLKVFKLCTAFSFLQVCFHQLMSRKLLPTLVAHQLFLLLLWNILLVWLHHMLCIYLLAICLEFT